LKVGGGALGAMPNSAAARRAFFGAGRCGGERGDGARCDVGDAG